MGWFDTHRFWQPYSQEYMFVWNWVVAKHTMDQLSPVATQKVKDRYASIVAANLAVSDHDVSLGHFLDMDYFWISVTLAEMGIRPMLGPKRAKWFCVVNHREGRRWAAKRGAPLAAQVLEDIFNQYGVRIQMQEETWPEDEDGIVVNCSFCSQKLRVATGRGTILIRCPTCSHVSTIET